jgi:hypothetical protein
MSFLTIRDQSLRNGLSLFEAISYVQCSGANGLYHVLGNEVIY